MSSRPDHEKVSEVFAIVCDLPESERRARLPELCEGDEALRAEVEALIGYDAGEDALFGRVDTGQDTFATGPMPDTIGGFRVVRLIGSGGMGDVFEAEQDSPKRRVAVKVLRPGFAAPAVLARFRLEWQIQATLRHPGIAQMYEAGVHASGGRQMPFFAMELVDGSPITEFCTAKNLDTEARLGLCVQLCDAVDHAHRQGVIHRDLKPTNILVEQVDGAMRVRVLDFGIAKMVETQSDVTQVNTETGQILGTLTYMSPEQFDAPRAPIDARADVHAIGIVLFELLTGTRPFDLTGRSLPDAARIVMEQDATRLSTLDKQLKGDLETIVARALEKDPSRRYPSAKAFGDDVRRFLSDQPIVARRATTIYQLSKFAKRNKALVGGVAATVVSLLIGIVVAVSLMFEAREREAEAAWQAYRASIAAAASAIEASALTAAERQLLQAPLGARAWEWSLLKHRIQGSTAIFEHDAVRGLARDDETGEVLSLGVDGRISVWSRRGSSLSIERSFESSLRLLSDRVCEGHIAGIDNDGNVLCVSTASGEITETIPVRFEEPRGLLLRDRGRRLVLWSESQVLVWSATDTYAWSPSRRDERSEAITAVDADEAGRVIGFVSRVTGPQAVSVFGLWHPEKGEPKQRRPGAPPTAVAVSPGGQTAVVGTSTRQLLVFDADTQEQRAVINGHERRIRDVDFLSDDRFVSIGQRLVLAHTLGANSPDAVLLPDSDERFEVIGLGAGGFAMFEREGGMGRVWDADQWRGLEHKRYVYNVAWSPDGEYLAAQEFKSDSTPVWRVADGSLVTRIPGETNPFRGVLGFVDDGSMLLLSKEVEGGSGMYAVRTSDWKPVSVDDTLKPFAERNARVSRLSRTLVRSPTGPYWLDRLRASEGGSWRLWRGDEVIAEDLRGLDAAWSSDGTWFALARNSEQGIEIRDGRSGALLQTVPQPSKAFSIDVHPDGTRLVTGGEDGVIRVFDTRRWDIVLELVAHESYVHALWFSPDGSKLASGSGDQTVRIWDSGQ